MKIAVPPELDAETSGIPLVQLVFCINLFGDKPVSELGPPAHATFDAFRNLVGDDALTFYATGTMRKHKAVNKRALAMLATRLAPGARIDDYPCLSFQASAEYNHAPTSLYLIAGREEVKGRRPKDATNIRLSIAPGRLADDPEQLVLLVRDLWAMVPLRSGQAGFALESTRYLIDPAHEHAYAKSMRHPGIDIPNAANDQIMTGFDRVRGIGWLTMLDDAFVAQLGGLEALAAAVGPDVEVLPLAPGGVMLRAGKAPQFGDVRAKDDLPAYKSVYAAVRSLMPTGRVPPLNIGGDFIARTQAWVHRFAP